jgi:thiamine pyrophosphokinase
VSKSAIAVLIDAGVGPATINVRFGDSISADELRDAWQNVSSGILAGHIRDAIAFECAKQGIHPSEVIGDFDSD